MSVRNFSDWNSYSMTFEWQSPHIATISIRWKTNEIDFNIYYFCVGCRRPIRTATKTRLLIIQWISIIAAIEQWTPRPSSHSNRIKNSVWELWSIGKKLSFLSLPSIGRWDFNASTKGSESPDYANMSACFVEAFMARATGQSKSISVFTVFLVSVFHWNPFGLECGGGRLIMYFPRTEFSWLDA